MATSSTSSEGLLYEYPYPTHVNALSFLSVQLTGKSNYVQWREQMMCLMDSHDMLGFIDGTIKTPHECNGSKRKVDMSTFEAKCREWKRSDTLVKGWIFGYLSEAVMGSVVGLQTARDVWNKLEKNYTIPTAPAPAPTSTISTKSGSGSGSESESESESRGIALKDVGEYIPLCIAIREGDWEKAQEFFIKDKHALIDKINSFGGRTLHVAIGNPDDILFLDNLLDLINPESLPTLLNNSQQNALHYAAILDNTMAAKKLVEKNPHLLFMVDSTNHLPVQQAVFNSHKNTFYYLIQVCRQYVELSKKDGYYSPFEGEKGVLLLCNTILSGFLDVAYDLLNDYPELAITKVTTNPAPLWCIARRLDAFPSAKRYNFYQRFIYSHVPTKNDHDTYKIEDVENQETNRANVVTQGMKDNYIYSVIQRMYVKFWNAALLHVPHSKQLQEDKANHDLCLMILKLICKEVGKLKSNHLQQYGEAIILAAKNNTLEVIEHISRCFPESIWVTENNSDYRLIQLSIVNRCEKVYNFFVHKVTQDKYYHNVIRDKDDNNLLHLAGQLAPPDKLSMVTGAALQMQREVQWFEEVSKFMRPKEREAKNKKQETPIMVFRKEHEDLRQKGEEWMKKTADSYTITAALIITVVFAAAITVPGGNNGGTGKAIYESRPSFVIFGISNAISFFTSTTSLLLFLSILTARYAEQDFLYKLPKRLILGLVMLFMSVTTMVIAFSVALYIMFGQGKLWILIPIAAIACLPITSFVTLQLPLLADLISSTYGHGLFGKRSELRITS